MRSLNPCPENFDQIVVVWVNYQSWGGGVNYQMQIVTKLPNENIQNYQLEMLDSGGGGGCKLPNANCDQTTKWKIFGIESGRPVTYCPSTKSLQ